MEERWTPPIEKHTFLLNMSRNSVKAGAAHCGLYSSRKGEECVSPIPLQTDTYFFTLS